MQDNTLLTVPKLPTSQKVGIVVSRYHTGITHALRDASIELLLEAGISRSDITVLEAPGSFEIPYLCQQLITTGHQGIIALGCVVRGGTDHYHYISQASTQGIMEVMVRNHIPITNAILTVDTIEQAQERSQGQHNKGYEAAHALMSVLQCVNDDFVNAGELQ